MGVVKREGQYGEYYGNDYNSSNALTTSQMQVNATYIYKYLTANGWTINSISAILGNMQAESSINSGRWQSDDVGNMSGGYSLTQWTPASKYINWCSGDASEMDNALSRIIWEVENKEQWYGRLDWEGMSFKEFSQSTASVSYLAKGFLLCYERPADQSEEKQEYRASLAENWYTYLSNGEIPPSEPDNPIIPSAKTTKKKKFNFLLYKRRVY